MTETIQDESLDLLTALKEKISEYELDALLIPHDDEYLSGDLTPDCERIATLTNFTGLLMDAILFKLKSKLMMMFIILSTFQKFPLVII